MISIGIHKPQILCSLLTIILLIYNLYNNIIIISLTRRIYSNVYYRYDARIRWNTYYLCNAISIRLVETLYDYGRIKPT